MRCDYGADEQAYRRFREELRGESPEAPVPKPRKKPKPKAEKRDDALQAEGLI